MPDDIIPRGGSPIFRSFLRLRDLQRQQLHQAAHAIPSSKLITCHFCHDTQAGYTYTGLNLCLACDMALSSYVTYAHPTTSNSPL